MLFTLLCITIIENFISGEILWGISTLISIHYLEVVPLWKVLWCNMWGVLWDELSEENQLCHQLPQASNTTWVHLQNQHDHYIIQYQMIFLKRNMLCFATVFFIYAINWGLYNINWHCLLNLIMYLKSTNIRFLFLHDVSTIWILSSFFALFAINCALHSCDPGSFWSSTTA